MVCAVFTLCLHFSLLSVSSHYRWRSVLARSPVAVVYYMSKIFLCLSVALLSKYIANLHFYGINRFISCFLSRDLKKPLVDKLINTCICCFEPALQLQLSLYFYIF